MPWGPRRPATACILPWERLAWQEQGAAGLMPGPQAADAPVQGRLHTARGAQPAGCPALRRNLLTLPHSDPTVNPDAQGETLEQQFGEKEVCFRTLDLYTSAVLESSLSPTVAPKPEFRSAMDAMSKARPRPRRAASLPTQLYPGLWAARQDPQGSCPRNL
jgi:hypothetical protein